MWSSLYAAILGGERKWLHVISWLVLWKTFAKSIPCAYVCWQGTARSFLRQQREAAALSAGDHRMADSQGRGAIGAAAHRRRRWGRPAPERVPPGKVHSNTFLIHSQGRVFVTLSKLKVGKMCDRGDKKWPFLDSCIWMHIGGIWKKIDDKFMCYFLSEKKVRLLFANFCKLPFHVTVNSVCSKIQQNIWAFIFFSRFVIDNHKVCFEFRDTETRLWQMVQISKISISSFNVQFQSLLDRRLIRFSCFQLTVIWSTWLC